MISSMESVCSYDAISTFFPVAIAAVTIHIWSEFLSVSAARIKQLNNQTLLSTFYFANIAVLSQNFRLEAGAFAYRGWERTNLRKEAVTYYSPWCTVVNALQRNNVVTFAINLKYFDTCNTLSLVMISLIWFYFIYRFHFVELQPS